MKTLTVFLLSMMIAHASWVAKINTEVISTEEFQQYINVKKLGSGQKKSVPIEDPEAIKSFLGQYIDGRIILKEAKKAGITSSSKEIKNAFEAQKDDWLLQAFLVNQIDMSSIDIQEKDLRKYFEEYKKKDPNVDKSVTYSKLNNQLKGQLYQAILAERAQELKDIYRVKLEKKNKVRKNKLTDRVVAVVNNVKIKNNEIVEKLTEQLKITGISMEQLKKRKPEYERALRVVRNELVLQVMVEDEMKEKNFANKKIVKEGLKILKENVISQVYIKNEIFDKIEVTEREKNELYESQKKNLASLGFAQVTDYLNNTIRKRKTELALKNFIAEKKEEFIIKRNYTELKKVK